MLLRQQKQHVEGKMAWQREVVGLPSAPQSPPRMRQQPDGPCCTVNDVGLSSCSPALPLVSSAARSTKGAVGELHGRPACGLEGDQATHGCDQAAAG